MIDDGAGHFEITGGVLSVERENARVADRGHGAVASFVGVVREHAGGKSGVTGIFYEAYAEMAEAKMAQVGAEAIARFANEKKMKISIVHRVGDLAVGDASVVIAVGSERRKEALAACSYAIDRLKEIVPIWKKEKFSDGAEWVGWGGDAPAFDAAAAPQSRAQSGSAMSDVKKT